MPAAERLAWTPAAWEDYLYWQGQDRRQLKRINQLIQACLLRARDRLLCDSFAMADQPRFLDRSRLGDGPLNTLSREELAELERALLGVLGIGLA